MDWSLLRILCISYKLVQLSLHLILLTQLTNCFFVLLVIHTLLNMELQLQDQRAWSLLSLSPCSYSPSDNFSKVLKNLYRTNKVLQSKLYFYLTFNLTRESNWFDCFKLSLGRTISDVQKLFLLGSWSTLCLSFWCSHFVYYCWTCF